MTKTLTEQWREGTLRGCFYWKLPNGNICTAYTDTMRDIKKVRDSDEVEVLQETPSYFEYKRLQELLSQEEDRIRSLLERVGEADKIIKYYAEKHGKLKACDYLNKWGVK